MFLLNPLYLVNCYCFTMYTDTSDGIHVMCLTRQPPDTCDYIELYHFFKIILLILIVQHLCHVRCHCAS